MPNDQAVRTATNIVAKFESPYNLKETLRLLSKKVEREVMVRPGGRSVPVIPNEAKVCGKLVGMSSEDGTLCEIEVESSQDVDNMPNFAQSLVGQRLKLFIPAGDTPGQLAVGDQVEAHVEYRGDERGGRFILAGGDLKKV